MQVSPVKVRTIDEFNLDLNDPEDPIPFNIQDSALAWELFPMSFMHGAAFNKLLKAKLDHSDLHDPDAGIYTASGGSMRSIQTF